MRALRAEANCQLIWQFVCQAMCVGQHYLMHGQCLNAQPPLQVPLPAIPVLSLLAVKALWLHCMLDGNWGYLQLPEDQTHLTEDGVGSVTSVPRIYCVRGGLKSGLWLCEDWT